VAEADDVRAISDLLFDYAARIDSGDLEGVAALFDTSTYRTEGTDVVLTGASEVLAAQRHIVRLYDGTPRTHHNITNLRVVIGADGVSAEAHSYYSVVFAGPGDEPRTILTGRYDDAFEKTDGRWRFVDRLIHLDQVGDLRGHLHLDRLGLDGVDG